MPLALAPALAASFPVFASLKSSLRPSEVTAEELSPWGDAEKQQSYSQGSFSASCCPLSRPAVTGCGLSQTLFFPAVKQLGSVMWENPWYWTYLCVRVCVSVAQCRLASASIFPAPSPSHGPSALVLPHLPSFYAFFTVSCKNTPPHSKDWPIRKHRSEWCHSSLVLMRHWRAESLWGGLLSGLVDSDSATLTLTRAPTQRRHDRRLGILAVHSWYQTHVAFTG